jgi:hypothetical protein
MALRAVKGGRITSVWCALPSCCLLAGERPVVATARRGAHISVRARVCDSAPERIAESRGARR